MATLHLLQHGALGRCFHTLCHHFDMQRAPHADDGTDNGTVPIVFGQAPHERLVDLELVDGQLLQISKAGVARPKVVDGEAHTKL